MSISRCFSLLLSFTIVLTLLTPLQAETLSRLTYSRHQLEIQVNSFEELGNRIRAAAAQNNAHVENLNLDGNNRSGNVNLKVAPGSSAGLISEMSKLGRVVRQNEYQNDNTSSYRQYEQKAAAFRALAKVDPNALFSKVPASERQMVKAEYESFVRDRLQSYETNLENYERQAALTEVQVTFTLSANAGGQQHQPQGDQQEETGAEEPASVQVQKAAPAGNLLPVYFLCFANLIALWAIYRRMEEVQLPKE